MQAVQCGRLEQAAWKRALMWSGAPEWGVRATLGGKGVHVWGRLARGFRSWVEYRWLLCRGAGAAIMRDYK